MKNYYELMNSFAGQDSLSLGRSVAKGILDNAYDNLDLYFRQYVKEFQNKENKRIFSSLERLAEGESDFDDGEMKMLYETVSTKTSQVVRQVIFAYDATNFFLSRNELNDLFPFLSQHIALLGKESIARKTRGMKPDSPSYHFEKATKISNEYDFFVKSLRNHLRKEYNVPLR